MRAKVRCMRACGTFAKPDIFRNVTRETRKHRNGAWLLRRQPCPHFGSTASRCEDGNCGTARRRGGSLFSKRPPRAADRGFLSLFYGLRPDEPPNGLAHLKCVRPHNRFANAREAVRMFMRPRKVILCVDDNEQA